MELDVIYMRRTKGEEAVQIYLSMDHDLIVQEYLCPSTPTLPNPCWAHAKRLASLFHACTYMSGNEMK